MRTFIRLSTLLTFVALIVALALMSCGGAGTPSKTSIETDLEKTSYAIGVSFYGELSSGYIDVDPQALARGIEDAKAGGDLLMSQTEIQDALTQLSMSAQIRYQEMCDTNLREATAFIVENAAKPGIVTLPDSLQYEVITEASGPMPKITDTVLVHYTGKLMDGSVFDSSVERGEPIDFLLGSVISGWQEALTLMPVGSKWRVFIPPQLAYGTNSPTPTIPPNSLLIFEVELLDIIDNTES